MFDNSWKKIPWLRRMFKLDRDIRAVKPFEPNKAQSSINWYNSIMQFDLDRRRIYSDVEEMDTWFAVNTGLDMYSEDAFPKDMDTDSMVWCTSHNHKVAQINQAFLKGVMGDKLYSIVRATAKYGCNNEQIIRTKNEIVATRYIRPDLITRVEDQYGRLAGFASGMQDSISIDGSQNIKIPDDMSSPWDFVQFRIPSKTQREFIHGETMLQAARRLWRQCKIVLDAMVLYRWLRAPDRWAYYIDCTGQTPEQQYQTVDMWRKSMTKKERYDSANGQYQNEFNPAAIDEDIWMPVSKDGNTRIEKFPTSSNVDDIADIYLLMGMFCASLRIPKAYMGFEEKNSGGAWVNKATLSQLDVRYARTIYRLQRAIMVGLTDMLKINLILHGINPLKKENAFSLHCAPVSYLDEAERVELYKLRIEIMNQLFQLGQSMNFNDKWVDYIVWKFLKLPKSMIKKIKRETPSNVPDMGGMGQVPNIPPQEQGGMVPDMSMPPSQEEPPTGEEGTPGPMMSSADSPYNSEFSMIEDRFSFPSSIRKTLDKVGYQFQERLESIPQGLRLFESTISSNNCQGIGSDVDHLIDKIEI